MAAMIESVDQGIGKLIETLDRTQQRNNTVVIFSSDNGGYGPATSMHPLKGYKGTYYEGGIREPLFFTWPGIIKSGTSKFLSRYQYRFVPNLMRNHRFAHAE